MTKSFLKATEMVVKAASIEIYLPPHLDVRWWGEGLGSLSARKGRSLGTALAVAQVQLLEDRPIDAGCAITGAIEEEGVCCAVTGVRAKVRDTLGGSVTRGVVPEGNGEEPKRGAEDAGRDPQKVIATAQNLGDACREASGLAQRLCDYFQMLQEAPDRQDRIAVYFDDRKTHRTIC